jgi:hypothetical protein
LRANANEKHGRKLPVSIAPLITASAAVIMLSPVLRSLIEQTCFQPISSTLAQTDQPELDEKRRGSKLHAGAASCGLVLPISRFNLYPETLFEHSLAIRKPLGTNRKLNRSIFDVTVARGYLQLQSVPAAPDEMIFCDWGRFYIK